ncbi:phosphatase PAP2 family protein [Actinomyces sp. ZJ308]|uniref:phosphatase PAP2 family protein n=1 Tax=Actinomyces sp. ZJ308 TaxID=2708342 RepID=UPI00141DE267|nr:phosphatase PAP2 family protein [Actinomyces sp. ZJ308]
MASFQSQTSQSLGRLRLRGGLLSLSCLAATLGLWGLFVFTHTGQMLDAMALDGSEIGSHYVSDHARTLLSMVSMPAAVILVVTILAIGLLRRSHRRAVWAVVAVVGANLTSQVLKYQILWRPDFNITERWDNANTLPSGHTTMAASAAVALILLSGRRWRALSAWAGALFTIAMGYSTLVCQWHRPSDVLAGILVPVAWGAFAVAGGAWRAPWSLRSGTGEEGSGEVPELTTVGTIPVTAAGPRLWNQFVGNVLLASAGIVCTLGALGLGTWVWRQLDGSGGTDSRWQLFGAYATGSVAVVGVTCLALSALVSLTDWGRTRHKHEPRHRD